jgi:CDP-diacylglycerol--inositol 3-phosphatidyltransferase
MSAVRNRANGSANSNGAAVQPNGSAKDHPYENIFLFIPNVIGLLRLSLFRTSADMSQATRALSLP